LVALLHALGANSEVTVQHELISPEHVLGGGQPVGVVNASAWLRNT
jgi:hypothetical protein